MDKVILTNALELLICSNYLQDASKRSVIIDLVEEAESSIKVPMVLGERDVEREFLIELKSTTSWALRTIKNNDFDLLQLKKRLKNLEALNVGSITILDDIESVPEIKIEAECKAYREMIEAELSQKRFRKLIRELSSSVNFTDRTINIEELIPTFIDKLSSFNLNAVTKGIESISGLVASMDCTDSESVQSTLKLAIDETSIDGILKSGYQGVNAMTGWHQGFRAGDFWMVAALQHNWKSGLNINFVRHFAMLNKPVLRDEKKKPLILHVSTENSITDNSLLMYQYIKENETHEEVDVTQIDIEDATAYIKEKTSINGFNVIFLRVNPSEFTYRSLQDLVHIYESQGYEIKSIIFDYLNMISKKGCLSGAQGMDTRDLFRRVRNFMSVKKILFITPHQISTDAKQLLRNGIDDLVKELAGKSYWDSCKTVDQEVDGCIICHIEIFKGVPYFTMMLDKHRKSGPITKLEDKYCCYRMHPAGAVRDDIMLESSQALKKVGGDLISAEQEWF